MSQLENFTTPLSRSHMPTDFSISLDHYVGRVGIGHGYRDGEQRIPGNFGPTQSMSGFEAIYPNIIDYIVRITYKIWEDRDVEYIASAYDSGSHVFDDYGLQYGNQKIIQDTYHTTGAFSNIRLVADEIVWAGNDEVGYHTSHRTLIRGTNDGDTRYGPATGKDVDVLVIANCVSKSNEIYLEHVLYNNSSLLRQLGFDLHTMAEHMAAEKPAGWPRDTATWNALRAAAAPPHPISDSEPSPDFDIDAFVRRNLLELWNNTESTALTENYIEDFAWDGPTDRNGCGSRSYRTFQQELHQCFPNLRLQVDEVYWMGNESDGFLTSERWSAEPTHTGDGIYGIPTHQPVQIWGITQHRVINGRIEREWTLFNELDLMMQIAAARQGD